MQKVLFVCLGIICRSPMAQAIFEEKLIQRGLESEFIAHSAGTAGYHIGKSPDPRTLEVLHKHGISFAHAADQLNANHLEEYDYVLAMDSSNYEDILSLNVTHSHKVKLFRENYHSDGQQNVPDPYYGGQDGFQEVYDILNEACDSFLNSLEN